MTQLLTDTDIPSLLETFYGRVRADTLLGPVFNEVIDDWPHHLGLLARFWSSVMLANGRYKGSPLAVHLRHADRITPEMFARWLEIWHATTDECLTPGAALAMQEKARRIGGSLQLALFYRLGPRCGHRG